MLEELSDEIDSFDKYKVNSHLIEAFYAGAVDYTRALCLKMREYSLLYAEEVMAADLSNEEKYDAMEEIYDCIYEDAGDEIYDEIYEGVLDESYDIFYDGILDDAYDTVDYSEWIEVRSGEYKWWIEARSDVYEEWLEFHSDVYQFWLDMRGELWSDDIERAEKILEDFSEDIEKLKEKVTSEESAVSDSEAVADTDEEAATEETTSEKATSEEFVDGMRPEFKEAMDSYETFYDEYCDLMKKYNENPTNATLLSEYADMLNEAAEMDEKFSEWEDEELNDAELKYYLAVNNRVMQKMLDVI